MELCIFHAGRRKALEFGSLPFHRLSQKVSKQNGSCNFRMITTVSRRSLRGHNKCSQDYEDIPSITHTGVSKSQKTKQEFFPSAKHISFLIRYR